jgi:hypothetical protein
MHTSYQAKREYTIVLDEEELEALIVAAKVGVGGTDVPTRVPAHQVKAAQRVLSSMARPEDRTPVRTSP